MDGSTNLSASSISAGAAGAAAANPPPMPKSGIAQAPTPVAKPAKPINSSPSRPNAAKRNPPKLPLKSQTAVPTEALQPGATSGPAKTAPSLGTTSRKAGAKKTKLSTATVFTAKHLNNLSGKEAGADLKSRKRPRTSMSTPANAGSLNCAHTSKKEISDTSSDIESQKKCSSAPYTVLPFHGDHRRAVSSVSFAPNRALASHGLYGKVSFNSNSNDPNSFSESIGVSENVCNHGNGILAMCASASADGSAKIWDITESMMEWAAFDFHRIGNPSENIVSSVNLSMQGQSKPSQPPTSSPTSRGEIVNDPNEHLLNSANSLPTPSTTTFSPISRLLHPKHTLLGHNRGINDVAFSPTASYLATASDDKTLRLWDVVTSTALVEFRGHTNFVFSCKFNPQSNLLVSGSFDESVKLWDVRCGDCVSTLPAHSDPVTGVDFNRDGTCIVSGSHDGLIRVWDTATGECLKTVYAEGNPPVSSVRFSPNGRYVLSGTLDGKLRLWDVASRLGAGNVNNDLSSNLLYGGGGEIQSRGGRCSKTFTGHQNTKFCAFATFSTVNLLRHCVVSGSEDGKVYLYDLQSRILRQTLEGHVDAVLAVDTHDSLELIVSGGMTNDKSVRFWSPISNRNPIAHN